MWRAALNTSVAPLTFGPRFGPGSSPNVRGVSNTRILEWLVFLMTPTFALDLAATGSKCRSRNTSWCRFGTSAAGMLAILVVAGSPAHADVIVVSSNASSIKAGSVLGNDKTLDVPSGARVRIMMPSGRTQELKGPAKVKVAELGRGEAINESLWNDVKRLVSNQKQATESTIGAVRSMAPKSATDKSGDDQGAGSPRALKNVPEPVPAPSFSWRRVPIDAGGDVCVEKGAALELLRGAPGRPLAISIVNMQSKKRAAAEFAVGSATAAWPADIGSEVGLYAVVMPDGVKRDIRLRPIAPLPEADETLRVLHGQRCLLQVEAWLRGQMTAAR